jgi:hypothetical protein
MTITLEISPAVQAELSRQATASGRQLEAYAAAVLENAVSTTGMESQATPFGASLVDACAEIRGLTDDVDFGRDPSTTWRPLDLS